MCTRRMGDHTEHIPSVGIFQFLRHAKSPLCDDFLLPYDHPSCKCIRNGGHKAQSQPLNPRVFFSLWSLIFRNLYHLHIHNGILLNYKKECVSHF